MSALEVGRVLAGYRVEAVAGRGGMGVVYRATQLGLERTVALKLIAAEFAQDEAFRERFQQESRVLASVDHPHVLTVYEADEAEGQLFISMRWIEGTDLSRLVKGGGGLDRGRAARIVAQVASALDAAHARGLVHRDIKPGNVLIEQREGQEHAWLADFGLAKKAAASSGGMTATGQFVGTLDYLAPEQIQGGSVDARADVYALGCVLFESLTGRVPYPRDSEPAKLFAHITEPPPRPRELRPELPDECDRIVARAMAKDPAERYPSAGDLGRAALAAAAGRASHEPERSVAAGGAAPAPAATTVAAPTPRRRLPRAALATAAIALLLATAAIAAIALTGDDEEPERTASPAAATGALPEPREPQIDRISLGAGAKPTRVEAGSGGAYVLDREAGEVIRVNPTSGEVTGRLPVGDPVDLELDGNRLWVASWRDRRIAEIDTRSFELVGRPFAVERRPSDIAPLADVLVVAENESDAAEPTLLRISKATHRPVGRPTELTGYVTDLAAVPGSLTVAASDAPRLSTYATTGLQIMQTPDTRRLKTDHNPTALVLEGSVAWVAVSTLTLLDDGLDLRTGREPHGTVLRVDLNTDPGAGEVGQATDVGREPQDLAVNRGVLWVPSRADGTITRIDTSVRRRLGKPLSLPELGDSVAAAGGVVWVTGQGDLVRITPR
jgi:predicted Ser/Thr protein kinase